MDLFGSSEQKNESRPLADLVRPTTLDDIAGQQHLFGPGKILRTLIESDRVPSMVLYGPPGTGKTTIAQVIASVTERHFYSLNAVMSGVADIRKVVDQASQDLQYHGERSILFIDEIHRFNKGQQDALLPFVERGVITFIGATTENPMFSLNGPLLSRTRIVELKPLSDEDLRAIVLRGLSQENRRHSESAPITIRQDALSHLCAAAGGDARKALNTLELACIMLRRRPELGREVDLQLVEEAVGRKAVTYDKDGDSHYDVISAFIKSVRGSDPQAAVYWLARMIYAGEDPRFIARRLIILASEDVGMANPTGLLVATAAADAVDRIGMPEARIILSHATIYLATSPKSNSALAIDAALKEVESGNTPEVPNHLKDAHYAGASRLGRGDGYLYPHSYPGHYVEQQYLPDSLCGRIFYSPSDQGYEARIAGKLGKG